MCILKKQKFLLYNILVEGFDTSSIFVSVVNKSIINLKITIYVSSKILLKMILLLIELEILNKAS